MVSFSRGKLNNDTQRVTAWQNEAVEYTSAFVTNIHNKIANEITKVEFNHVKYKKSDVGSDTLISKAGSDLDEVLNWSSKGEHNSMEFWQKVIKKLLCTRYVDLYPKFDRETGDLADLLLTNDGKEYKPEEIVRLFSLSNHHCYQAIFIHLFFFNLYFFNVSVSVIDCFCFL